MLLDSQQKLKLNSTGDFGYEEWPLQFNCNLYISSCKYLSEQKQSHGSDSHRGQLNCMKITSHIHSSPKFGLYDLISYTLIHTGDFVFYFICLLSFLFLGYMYLAHHCYNLTRRLVVYRPAVPLLNQELPQQSFS